MFQSTTLKSRVLGSKRVALETIRGSITASGNQTVVITVFT